MVEHKLQTAWKKLIYRKKNKEDTHRKVMRRDLVVMEVERWKKGSVQ